MIEERLSSGDVCTLIFDRIEQREIFRELLYSFLYDYKWCHENGIDYLNPDIGLAKRCAYDEMLLKRRKSVA